MKSLPICLALITMLMTSQQVMTNQEATSQIKYLKHLECHHPNPPAHCSLSGVKGYQHVPANPYDRGCSAIHRCRGGRRKNE
ncbi:hypothetical protein SDJN02_17551, partial [Cucurbita argyrosperma subsp. argyrosperma]